MDHSLDLDLMYVVYSGGQISAGYYVHCINNFRMKVSAVSKPDLYHCPTTNWPDTLLCRKMEWKKTVGTAGCWKGTGLDGDWHRERRGREIHVQYMTVVRSKWKNGRDENRNSERRGWKLGEEGEKWERRGWGLAKKRVKVGETGGGNQEKRRDEN